MTTNATAPGYRWIVLAAATVVLALIMGQIVNGLSVYFVPLEAEQGWSRADVALINSLGLLGLAIGSLVAGFAADRFGVRPVVLVGVIAAGVGWIVASRVSTLGQFYAVSFAVGAIGGGAIAGPVMALVGNWFAKGAGLALGIAAAGQATGQGGMPFAGAMMIDAAGWRTALAAQGFATLVLLVPLALLLKGPAAGPAGITLSNETPSGLPNWLVTGWVAAAALFCCICMAVPLMHLVPLIQGTGIGAPEAGSVLFTMMMVAIAGRVAFGRLADLIGAIPTYLIASGWQTVLVLGFVFVTKLDGFYIYAMIFGFGYAGVMTSIFVTVRTITAPARRASSMGIVLTFAYIGHGIGGWQGGMFFDLTGAYDWTFRNAALAGAVNLALLSALWMTLRRPPRPAVPLSA